MTFPNEIKIRGSAIPIELRAGLSSILVGANGSGKTRLAVELERSLGEDAHRISAQRMLAIDPSMDKISESRARGKLRYGYPDDVADYGGAHQARENARWGGGAARYILDDAGALLQVLFGEQANTAVASYNARADGTQPPHTETVMRRLKAIFERVLPTRQLVITADDITVLPLVDGAAGEPYSVTQMSDGEKAVFYIIGQVLVAEVNLVFIMDEPEIHVHRSILARLWDELEAARPDCAFLLITHDLEFAASRAGKKYVVRSYAPVDGWVIEDVPEAEGFAEDVVTLILGSRKPILFVEGEQGSLDVAFYRACYPSWTVIPRGSCDSVIHSVVTMRHNEALTRVQCAGLVDADSHDDEDRKSLTGNGIQVLPVSEIENLLLLPSVSRAILMTAHMNEPELSAALEALQLAVFADASDDANVQAVVLRHCRRRIDRMLKQVDLSAEKTVPGLAADYIKRTAAIDVVAIASEFEAKVRDAVADGDLAALLAVWDRKRPLLSLAASHLRHVKVDVFSAWATRAVQSVEDDRLREALRAVLPVIDAA